MKTMSTTGLQLEKSFLSASKGAQGEIALFRALISSFRSLGSNALSKEYHGTRYQVTFQQQRGAGRTTPRCELCDLLLIHYPAGKPSEARLTWNQAKLTSKPLHNYLAANKSKAISFKGNLEQWDLLAHRPSIKGASSRFKPPKDLLSAALLPSVGTFGVFYPYNNGFNFAYFVADTLKPLNNNQGRSGTLYQVTPFHQLRLRSGYVEVTAACCLSSLGDALDCGCVGTPIASILARSQGLKSWLSGLLISLQQDEPGSELPGELMRGLGLPEAGESGVDGALEAPALPTRAVVLLRTGGEI